MFSYPFVKAMSDTAHLPKKATKGNKMPFKKKYPLQRFKLIKRNGIPNIEIRIYPKNSKINFLYERMALTELRN